MIPYDDPTILFTNAGMNQFKDIFTGTRKVDYKRATSSQKCIRAGGKHNDLDNVGFTARHHTFFEMLGNWSFGDYFKEQAIYYAWEWVTKELGLPKDRLYASVYETDDDAFALWEKIAPELKNGRVMRFGKKDNYWSMGETGPCGPCSEIHFDRGEKYGTGPEAVVNGESDRFTEIWNLVFMQFDQLPDGRLAELPFTSVDTGAGLERLTAILQGADTNYGIDLFQHIIGAISEVTGSRYEDNVSSHNVVADHLRALSFAIADGAGISNEGQGYVLRRVLRRAARHGRLLGASEPFIYKLVPSLVDVMGEAYPDLREKQSHIENVIKAEEESFGQTLETGLLLFEKVAGKVKDAGGTVVEGEDVFKLYDTYGFPFDLTEIIAAEQGLSLDHEGFEKAMARQKELSRASADFHVNIKVDLDKTIENLASLGLESQPTTEFFRDSLKVDARVVAVDHSRFPEISIVLDRTPFYVEAGGQISDIGKLYNARTSIEVTGMHNHQDYYIHLGKVTKGTRADLELDLPVTAEVDAERRWDIMRNHTVTHLTHAALRQVLGAHIKQSGSFVGPERMRFDFSHHKPMTPEEITEVERIVNNQIIKGTPVETAVMDIDSARASGATALFGEKYGEEVRVVSVPGFSKELCGGTHVADISQIGPFFITLETGIASGVRRMEAITGREAINYMLAAKVFRQQTAQLVGRPEPEALEGVRQIRESAASLQKEIRKVKEQMFAGTGQTVGKTTAVGSLSVITHDFGTTDRGTMAAWADTQKAHNDPVAAFGLGEVNGKRTFIAAGSSSAINQNSVNVGKTASAVLPQFGGRGGGKPSFAQGSVADDTDSEKFFEAIVATFSEGK